MLVNLVLNFLIACFLLTFTYIMWWAPSWPMMPTNTCCLYWYYSCYILGYSLFAGLMMFLKWKQSPTTSTLLFLWWELYQYFISHCILTNSYTYLDENLWGCYISFPKNLIWTLTLYMVTSKNFSMISSIFFSSSARFN